MKLFIASIACLSLCSCGTTGGIAVANFLESPANQKILDAASTAGAASIISSTGTKLTPEQQTALMAAGSAALDAGATGTVWAIGEALRTKQQKGVATPTGALTATITNQSGASTAAALPVAQAVNALTQSGVPANVANEAVARTVQAVAAQKGA